VRVAYETRGDGPRAVVFLHGWSADRRHWRRQMQDLATDRRLVAVDLPGHGESDKPEVPYAWPYLARAVAGVLDAVGIERAVLVGHSNGVPVAHACLGLDDRRVEGLVAVDGPFRLAIAPPMLAWMKTTLARPDAAAFMASQADRAPVGRLRPEDQAIVKDGVRATPVHVHAGGLAGVEDPASWSTAPIAVPLLVVAARTAGPGPGSEGELAYVRALAPHAEVEIWDSSHFVMMEHAERFNRRLEAFVKTLV